MKVSEIMTSDVGSCGPRTNAAAIAEICWNRSCGAVPVVDETNKVLGMVTDRDLFIALATRNRRASDLVAGEVMSKDVTTCSPDDDVMQALSQMHSRKVRRIPVVDRNKTLVGILSLANVVRVSGNGSGIPQPAVMSVLTRLCEKVEAVAPKRPALASVGTI
jgi:CBS domain-containing protein